MEQFREARKQRRESSKAQSGCSEDFVQLNVDDTKVFNETLKIKQSQAVIRLQAA